LKKKFFKLKQYLQTSKVSVQVF